MSSTQQQSQVITILQDFRQILIDSPDESLVSDALLSIRKMTSLEINPEIQSVIDVGLIDVLIGLGSRRSLQQMDLLNILWTLTNVCSGTSDQTRLVVEKNGLDLFLRLCYHSSSDIVAQSFWGIGNIAGDSLEYRNMLHDLGCVHTVCSVIDKPGFLNQKDLGTAIWVLCNLARGKPSLPFEKTKEMVPYLVKALDLPELEIKVDCIWGLAYISESEESHSALIQLDIAKQIFRLNQPENNSLNIGSLRVLGNLATGNDQIGDYLVYNDVLKWILALTKRIPKVGVQKEVLWTLSNIAAGTKQHQAYLFNDPNFLEFITNMLITKPEESKLSVLKELYFVLGNLTSHKCNLEYFIGYNWHSLWIKHIYQLQQKCDDLKFQEVFLEAMNNLTKTLEPDDIQIFTNQDKEMLQTMWKNPKGGQVFRMTIDKVLGKISMNSMEEENKKKKSSSSSLMMDEKSVEEEEEEEEHILTNKIEQLNINGLEED